MIQSETILRHYYPKVFQYPSLFKKSAIALTKFVIHENSLNQFMKVHEEKKGIEFIDAVLNYLGVSYKTTASQMENIPSLGKVIVVANHPLGALDALCLIQMIHKVRQDKKIKIVANKMLGMIPQIKEFLISVDNMNDKVSKEALRQIDQALNNEEVVIFFPSGEVTRAGLFGIKEKSWKGGFVKFAKRNGASVLPIHIHAKNSSLFYMLSSIYKPLGTLLLSHEIFAARNQTYDFTIGEIVNVNAINDIQVSDKKHAQLFKKHLQRLSKSKKGIYPTECAIVHPVSRQEIKQELRLGEQIGLTTDNKQIYLFEYDTAPNIMQEIGRLREYAFRKVGEGSGKAKDLDEYDRYYHHLVLWDDEALEIAGAYRIGDCEWILSWLGKEGLYLNSLCEINDKFEPILEQSIELGRSFVQPKYWGTRALDYLWQGIGAYLSHNPHIKYMYGPVSISGKFPQHAKDALVYFYKNWFPAKDNYLRANFPYQLSNYVQEEFKNLFDLEDYSTDFKHLKDYLKSFDVSVPTLYKQYSELCEEGGVQFLDFGIDSDFNDCVDGYILVDIRKILEAKRQRYIRAIN